MSIDETSVPGKPSRYTVDDIMNGFRRLLSSYKDSEFSFLPIAVMTLVAAGSVMYILDLTALRNDETWEVVGVTAILKDPGYINQTKPLRTVDFQWLSNGFTLGNVGRTTLGNQSTTHISVFASSTGWGNWTLPTPALVTGVQTPTKQLYGTMPPIQLITPQVVDLAFVLSLNVTLVSSYVIVRRRRRTVDQSLYLKGCTTNTIS